MALSHHITGAILTLATLRGHTQLKLDVVKTHAGPYMAENFPVRNTFADTNNHGTVPLG